jgi:CHAT domain-containing protein
MKKMLFLVLWLLPCWLSAQSVDAVALRQVDSLNTLCESIMDAEDYETAFTINEAAQQKAASAIGLSSAAYGRACLHRAYLYYFSPNANLTEAAKWGLESRSVYAKASGVSSLEYGLYLKTNNRTQSEALLLESISAFEQFAGREHADYAAGVLVLGALYQRTYGIYTDNECYFLQYPSLLRLKGLVGEKHPSYVQALQNVGDFFTNIHHFEGAETVLTEAKALRAASDKESLAYAEVLLLLSDLYGKWGRYEQAQPFIEEAIDVVKRKVGKSHSAYASVLNKAALFYEETDSNRAKQYWREAEQILEKIKGISNDYYLAAVKNLIEIYTLRGDYFEAGNLHRISRKMLDGMLGISSVDYSKTGLNNVGFVSTQDRKVMLFEESQKIMQYIVGSDQSFEAGALAFLGEIFLMKGGYEQAQSSYRAAAAIQKKILDEQDRRYAATLDTPPPAYSAWIKGERKQNLFNDTESSQSLRSLSTLYDQRNQSEQTGVYWAYFNKTAHNLIKKAAQNASEHRYEVAGAFAMPMPSPRMTKLFELLQQTPLQSLASACYDDALFFKGVLLKNTQTLGSAKNELDTLDSFSKEFYEDVVLENTQALGSPKNGLDTLRIIYADWLNTLRQLDNQYNLPLSDQKRISALNEKKDMYEEGLNIPLRRLAFRSGETSWKEVQSKLQEGEVAIEFVSYPKGSAKDNTCYVALVLLPNAEAPLFIPLFKESELAAAFPDATKDKDEFYNALYDPNQQGAQLYDLIWKPLAAFLPAGAKVYFSPAGLLHRLNLPALPTPAGKTAAELWNLIQLQSTGQLVQTIPPATSTTAVLYGGIEYDDAATTKVVSVFDNGLRGPNFSQTDSTLRGATWGYLKWTDVEVKTVAPLLQQKGYKTNVMEGIAATEASLKSLGDNTNASPSVLHIATHGYFYPDPAHSADPLGSPSSQNNGEKNFKASVHPMIRSGLILAGGNHAWKTGRPLYEGQEDGILTAFEISQMNLSNTELVVLSACETGLGDIKSREGVYGLQRAFKIAGARYLIMSLWQVPDFQTQVFMSAFYKHWLEGEMTIPDAFRQTQMKLKAKYGEAFKWAGFVLVE